MGYEALIIFTTIATSNFTDNRKELNKNFLDLKSESTKKSLFFKGTIFAMILFVFTCLLIFPSLKNYISFFIAGSEEENIRNYIRLLNIRANVPSIIYWIYIMFVDLLQIFLPIVLIEYIFKKIGRHNTKRALLLSFCIIFMVLLFMTPEKARSIQLAVSLFLVLHFIYPQHIRKIIPFALVFVSIFSLIALLLKSGVYREESDLWGFVSETLNAYFSGPLNVVASISMQQNSSIKLIISDILNSLPFVKHYFMEWDTTPKYFNYSIKGTGATVSKIIPMIGQGYFYFGFLLSPIISIISIKVAMKLEKIANLTTNIFKRYLYIFATINFALSPVLYNFNISLSTFWDIIIILILMKLADLKLRKKTIGI
ncbi:hypothetical protein PSAB_18480 [Paenibacillus sabinae T27]|uniref:Oligosaccharide repeat unit polymerase n=2 Tax=Paenibacillus sabinae TaxID=365617 RepID=X4ZPZ0_9BACL|nr:hypothetical protein PSAB_18480 [Paenibacillus sabinae T27]